MSDRLDKLDYYTLLGVAEDANSDAIRAAFHTFALKYHPDNHGGTGQEGRATEIFRRGTEAYRVLRDPTQRVAYDRTLEAGGLRLKVEEARPQRLKKTAMNVRARPFFIKAEQALKAGKHSQAKLNVNIALQHQPEHPDLLALLGRLGG